ncbi:PilW family protein [Ramlibacter algicola]|uniref:PilW family protein n=1 Tax=Ramlibacter algicola TaxID=2795217 RepID=A0A934PYL7_9BURK|nr:PilW family protein [Ramlibacter algicola]MBK0392945.1 PilW family protein [Ramlibacter algicola]
MTKLQPSQALRSPARQRGLTLVEFMISIVLGMIMVAALATLIADQSNNRAEVERNGRLIENGRYSVRMMVDDLQMAGYWGELSNTPAYAGAALPDPCELAASNIKDAMGIHVQAYDWPAASAAAGYNATGTAPTLSCIGNVKPGTDVIVVRHADPDASALQTGGITDMNKVAAAAGSVMLQTGMIAATQGFDYMMVAASSTANTNTTNFTLVKKDLTTRATLRKTVVRIYYVSSCSVEVAGSCVGADNGNPIPTLKMAELSTAGGAPAWTKVSLAEGIENLQVTFGVDSDNDGAPNGLDVAPGSVALASWPDVMSAKLTLLVRSNEASPGYSDAKTYAMGTVDSAGTDGTVVAASDRYRRHVFVQSVRFVNPSGRRTS